MGDVDEDEDEEEVVVLGDAGRAVMRAVAGLWAAASEDGGHVLGQQVGGAWLGGPARDLAAQRADLVGSAGGGRRRAAVFTSGLGCAGVLQCVRSCGLASAGGNSLRRLHSGAGGVGFRGCVRGACAGHWAGWACCGAWGSMRWEWAGRRVWGVLGGFGRWVRGGRVRLFWRVGEAPVAGPGGARAGWRVRAGWVAGGEGQGRRFRGGGCRVGVCVRLQRCACVVSCRPGGLEEKLAFFCGRGEDFADERAYLLQLLVSGGKRVPWLSPKADAAEDPVDGGVPAGEGVLWGGGSFRVSAPASTCMWAVGMAEIQGTVPVDSQRRWIHWARQSMASPSW